MIGKERSRARPALFLAAGGLMNWLANRVERVRRWKGEAAALGQRAAVLGQSEELFRTAFENGAVAMTLTGMDGRIMRVNGVLCRMLGFEEQELVGRKFAEITHPDDLTENLRGMDRVWRGEASSFRMEKRYLRKDGGVVWGDMATVAVRDAHGVGAYCVTHVQDITERKRAEEALRESEQKFKALFDHSKDAILIYDMAGHFADANQEACERLGYSREELLQMGPRDIDSPQSAAKVAARLEQLRQQGHALFETEQQRRDGSRVLVELNCSLVELEGKQLVFSTCRDISARKAAEEALRRAEAGLAQAVRVAGLGTFERDHRRGVIEYSPVTRQLLGFGEKEEVTLEAMLERVVPQDREALAAAIQRAHDPAGNGLLEVEYRVAGRDGRIRWVSKRAQTFFEGDGKQRRPVRTIGAVLDVTARKEVQVELERQVAERTARLQELVGELEHFSYTITHDLKSPLRAIKSFAELTSRWCADCTRPQAREALEQIASAAGRMDCLITDALNYSRSVRQELPLRDVDTGALLRGMLETYPELQRSKAHIELAGELPLVVGNEAGLTQCFSNLLGNALKFVKPGERPRIRVWAEARRMERGSLEASERGKSEIPNSKSETNPKSKDRNSKDLRPAQAEGEPRGESAGPSTLNPQPSTLNYVRIWVEDQGIGISKEMLPRVFDMFSRGSKDYEGTGIGLALVRKVTQRMGGRVGVESEEGRGSRFWIELQLGEAPPQVSRAASAPAEPKGGTVLYVEDEQSDATFMKMAFAAEGLESALRVVGDGRAALEYLSGRGKYGDRREYPRPSVVLLDLNLPQVPGFEVLKWMRSQPEFARTPVVVFSSSTREDDQLKAAQLGANEFVGKPSSGLKFGEVVERLRKRWMLAAAVSAEGAEGKGAGSDR